MDDLISRQKAIEVASRECHELRGVFSDIEHGLKELPSAQKTGKWIDIQVSVSGDGRATCDQCGAVVHNSFSSSINFCPNCGSYNGGEQDDNNKRQ